MGLMMLGKLHTYQELLPHSSGMLRLVLKGWGSKKLPVTDKTLTTDPSRLKH